MKWAIDDNCRCDLLFYTGVGLAGEETVIRIFPSGKQGELERPFQSMRMGATQGLRVYLCTSTDDEHWTNLPWRCIRVVKGVGLKTGTRRILLNVEARPTFYQHPLFVLAGALFVDAGRAWNPGAAGKAKWGFGAGGRVGLPRVYNTPVMRADLAYGAADRVWQLSFGVGQYF